MSLSIQGFNQSNKNVSFKAETEATNTNNNTGKVALNTAIAATAGAAAGVGTSMMMNVGKDALISTAGKLAQTQEEAVKNLKEQLDPKNFKDTQTISGDLAKLIGLEKDVKEVNKDNLDDVRGKIDEYLKKNIKGNLEEAGKVAVETAKAETVEAPKADTVETAKAETVKEAAKKDSKESISKFADQIIEKKGKELEKLEAEGLNKETEGLLKEAFGKTKFNRHIKYGAIGALATTVAYLCYNAVKNSKNNNAV